MGSRKRVPKYVPGTGREMTQAEREAWLDDQFIGGDEPWNQPATGELMKGSGYGGYQVSAGGVVSGQSKEKSCTHDGSEVVYVVPGTGTNLLAAQKTYAKEAAYICDLVIDCGAHISTGSTGSFVRAVGTVGKEQREKIEGLNDLIMVLPPIASLDWPDQGIPAGGLAFWHGLVGILPNPGNVLVCCIGGHGRTGTAIASIVIATQPGITAKAAIDYVRARHCKHAVESLAQERYLCALALRAREVAQQMKALAKADGHPPNFSETAASVKPKGERGDVVLEGVVVGDAVPLQGMVHVKEGK
jgi:hypothetical protein